jgi:hypothetical protein
MAGSVQLRLGEMFEGASDLVVLPVSTAGTVSKYVSERLSLLELRAPAGRLHLGDVVIEPFHAENVASYVAFAASVEQYGSSPAVIRRIGQQIGRFTRKQPAVEIISAPVLGARAGGLESFTAASALRDGFLTEAAATATLRIYVLEENDYVDLQGRFAEARDAAKAEPSDDEPSRVHSEPIRVFVSYTKSSDNHAEWVLDLATFLRSNGFNARLDAWHLRLGAFLPQWMTNEVQLAQRVLMICDREYADRADGLHGGVGWEIRIIQGDLLQHQMRQAKYIPIVRTESYGEGVPTFLEGSYGLHWPPSADEAARRAQLVADLLGVRDEPPIGPPLVAI